MYEVSEATKRAFMTDGSYKTITVKFPWLFFEVTNEHILQDSFSVEESILEGNSLEFVGCIASKMEVTITDFGNNFTQIVKDTYVEVEITAYDEQGLPTMPVTVFKGFVDSAKKTANKKKKHIIAYDPFCKMQNIDVTNFYNSRGPITVSQLLALLIGYIRDNSNMRQLSIENNFADKLCNGWIIIDGGTTKKASGLSAIALLKSICQINGVFGYFDPTWSGLEFKIMDDVKTSESLVFPSENTYLGSDVYLVSADHGTTDDFYFDFYKEVEYEDYRVKNIDQIVIRNGSEEDDITVGDGDNRYIIRNNIFMQTADEETKRDAATCILEAIGHVDYVPFSSDNNGLPFIRCGDEVAYRDIAILDDDKEIHFIVFARTLKGDQVLRDCYKADGDEYQREFITEINVNLSDIESKLKEHDKEIADLQEALDEHGGGWKVESVNVLPASPSPYTLYLIRGRTVIYYE